MASNFVQIDAALRSVTRLVTAVVIVPSEIPAAVRNAAPWLTESCEMLGASRSSTMEVEKRSDPSP